MQGYDRSEHLRLLAVHPVRRTRQQQRRLEALMAERKRLEGIAAMHAMARMTDSTPFRVEG